jgi:hypothetical protein
MLELMSQSGDSGKITTLQSETPYLLENQRLPHKPALLQK